VSEPLLSCQETFRRLDDYLDRELSAQDMVAVEAHLRACAICAPEFEVERELLDAIRARLTRLRVPEELKARISALLDRE
jgi:anti-sigma factor (TIGR02949 family)